MILLGYKGIVNHDREALVRSLKLYDESGLDIVDCILCINAEGHDRRLFSFDVKLNRMMKKRHDRGHSLCFINMKELPLCCESPMGESYQKSLHAKNPPFREI